VKPDLQTKEITARLESADIVTSSSIQRMDGIKVTEMNKSKNSLNEEYDVSIKVPSAALEGSLYIPAGGKGIVMFAHGSGSSRLSPRNHHVSGELQKQGMGTLLFDLLTQEEEKIDDRTGRLRFDIGFLARRLIEVTDWLLIYLEKDRELGYFGASTGAAAAIVAAAQRPNVICAVVSRGGRPDLANEALPRLKAPILLLVGGADREVIEMNREAEKKIKAEKSLVIIPGATHLFEEPGALDEVARLAFDWFQRHFEDK
jgi:putative phosphoribosyl transferase